MNGTDHAEGDHVLAFGNEASAVSGEMMRLKRSRPGRRGQVVVGNTNLDHDLRVYGDIQATLGISGNTPFSLRAMYTALTAIADAANDSYSDLQQFKDAIKTSIGGIKR